MRLIREKRTPVDLIEVARLGGEAETVQRVMGETLRREMDSLISQLSSCKQVGEYAFVAGQMHIIRRLMKSLDIQLAEGREAAAELREG